jgi:hypothetical protein
MTLYSHDVPSVHLFVGSLQDTLSSILAVPINADLQHLVLHGWCLHWVWCLGSHFAAPTNMDHKCLVLQVCLHWVWYLSSLLATPANAELKHMCACWVWWLLLFVSFCQRLKIGDCCNINCQSSPLYHIEYSSTQLLIARIQVQVKFLREMCCFGS